MFIMNNDNVNGFDNFWTVISCIMHMQISSGFVHLYVAAVHYSDVILGPMASQITNLSIVYSAVYSGPDKKKPIKALCHWPLCGEFTGDRWIPRTNNQ